MLKILIISGLLLIQTQIEPVSTAEPSNAFSGYVGNIIIFLYAVGGLLAIMAMGRIYNNYNIGEESLLKGAMNLFYGMIFLIVIIQFISLLI